MASGGFRPGAKQNNPANVKATGGNGQSGQYKGFAYGQNKALNDSRAQGNAAVASVAASSAPAGPPDLSGIQMPSVGTFGDPTNNPSEPISAGSDFGRGVGSSALPTNISANTRPDENQAIISQYMPDLIHAAAGPDAPDSFKRFVNYLAGK